MRFELFIFGVALLLFSGSMSVAEESNDKLSEIIFLRFGISWKVIGSYSAVVATEPWDGILPISSKVVE